MTSNSDAKRTLILFRHGQTGWNRAGRIQGHLDVPLNFYGRQEAFALRTLVESLGVERILSSDLCRAWETAEIAARGRVPITRDARLRETFLGRLQGLTKDEVLRIYPRSEFEARFPYLSDETVQGLGGEMPRSVRDRAVSAVEDFLLRSPCRILGVSSHGGVIRRLIQHAFGHEPESDTLPPPVPNTVVYPIEIDLATRRWSNLPTLPLPARNPTLARKAASKAIGI